MPEITRVMCHLSDDPFNETTEKRTLVAVVMEINGETVTIGFDHRLLFTGVLDAEFEKKVYAKAMKKE
jgi:hypothetical protein